MTEGEMIRSTREISRVEFRRLKRKEASLEALKAIAWMLVFTAFLFLGWVATWAHWLEGVGL